MGNAETKNLVEEIDDLRDHLADTIDELIDRTSPKSIARRALERVKARFVDESGSPRLETIVPVVAAVAGTVAAAVVIRRLTN
ncbi:hypothetical protein HMPREF0063_11363 [Aeromicrobium marinum DSM 15272]|uniref:DUF3618 domain-containing protein n=1 Tax=Aeromicrobium marinum DSM 15272 TaxID=585531 RepID=E2SBF4_9ACTN|nr:DUF3618 domain-containing protein [Aeromicrobium marinum]EFQ83700.1 hypothetical protein HMPREF0063_11363 [Aeromicrobium marinum DSM 15272]